MKYSIDTSALLEAWRRHYPPDVFPALWSSLDELIESDELAATEEVFFELERKDDEVCEWAKERCSSPDRKGRFRAVCPGVRC